MTVSTTTNSVIYRGNGAATSFAVPFKVVDEDHLVVRRRIFETGVFEHTYIGTDYSYTGLGADSGTLELAGDALDDDYELVIQRIVPYTQDLDIVNSGGFYPETVEEQLDLIVMSAQQLDDQIIRTMLAPPGETIADLPIASVRAEMYLGFDENGDPVSVEAIGSGDGGVATEALLRAGHDNVERTQRIAGDEAIDARLDLLEAGQANGFVLIVETWADLEAITGQDNQGAVVVTGDTGTHVEDAAFGGGTVDNHGQYTFVAPTGWKRIGDTDAAIALDAAATATAAAASFSQTAVVRIYEPTGIVEQNYLSDQPYLPVDTTYSRLVYRIATGDGTCDISCCASGVVLHTHALAAGFLDVVDGLTLDAFEGDDITFLVENIVGEVIEIEAAAQGLPS